MTSHLMIMFYSMRSQESYLVVLRHHVSKINNISIGQVKAIRKLRHVRDQRLLRRAAYLQETETTLLYAAHRWSARKWDTYGVHTTGNKPNLMRSRGEKKGGIDQGSKNSFYQTMLKNLALQSIPPFRLYQHRA